MYVWPVEIVEKFKRRCPPPDSNGCILWIQKNQKDYGVFHHRMEDGIIQTGAHRIAFAIANNVALPDMRNWYVCHRCDRPGCVNSAHLFLGTAYDNSTDRMLKLSGLLIQKEQWDTIDTTRYLKTERVSLDMSSEDRIIVELAAHIKNMPPSRWVRMVLVEKANKVLQQAQGE